MMHIGISRHQCNYCIEYLFLGCWKHSTFTCWKKVRIFNIYCNLRDVSWRVEYGIKIRLDKVHSNLYIKQTILAKLIYVSKRGPMETCKLQHYLDNELYGSSLKKHCNSTHWRVRSYCYSVYVKSLVQNYHNSMVSCQKGLTRHAYIWQIGPIWQDTTICPVCWHQTYDNFAPAFPLEMIPYCKAIGRQDAFSCLRCSLHSTM